MPLQIDILLFCPYCGDTMSAPTEEQVSIFGPPKCCDYEMVVMDRNKLHTVVKALDRLKESLEAKILEGMI